MTISFETAETGTSPSPGDGLPGLKMAGQKGKEMKYIIYLDYNSGTHHIGYEYIGIYAKTDFEAIEAADKIWNEDKHYLIRIMKKTGKVEKMEDGWKKQYYTAVMCKRSNAVGWHANDEAHSEGQHTAYRAYKKDLEYFEVR